MASEPKVYVLGRKWSRLEYISVTHTHVISGIQVSEQASVA